MSELTKCNFCDLRWMKQEAEKRGMVVTTLPGDHEVAGRYGVDVLVHRPDEEPDRKAHWKMWCAELTDYCCC